MRPLRALAILAVLAGGLLGAHFLYATRPQPVPAVLAEQAWPVASATVPERGATPTLTLFGRIDSPSLTELSAAIAAEVLRVHAVEGDEVEAGALLLELDRTEAELRATEHRSELADLQAQIAMEMERERTDRRSLELERDLLELSEGAVRRAEELAQNRLGSRSQLDERRTEAARQRIALENRMSSLRNHAARLAQLRARLERARAQSAQADLDLRRTRIRAPFAGRVTDVWATPGRRVRVGDRLAALYDTTRLEVRAQVPAGHLSRVRSSLERAREPGAEPLHASARVDGVPLRLRLDRLAGRVGAGQGGLDALFAVQSRPAPHLGRALSLTVELAPLPAAFALPLSALYGTDRVYRIVPAPDGPGSGDRAFSPGHDAPPAAELRPTGTLEQIPVTVVAEQRDEAGQTRILVHSAALRPGDRIVATQLPNAVPGLPVRTVAERR